MTSFQDLETYFRDSIETKRRILNDQVLQASIVELAETSLETLQNGYKIIFCGNGGSFADAQHLAGEFVSRFMIDRAPLPALALGTNSSNLSAIGNDYGYEYVFARELNVIADVGDLFIPISTSGKSRNILEAVKVAKAKGIKCIGLTGEAESTFSRENQCINVPSTVTAHIQESHITIGHFVCKYVEEKYF